MTKHLRMSSFVMKTSQRTVTKLASYRYEMLGAKIKKDAVPKFLAQLGLNHRKFLFAVIRETPLCHRQEVK